MSKINRYNFTIVLSGFKGWLLSGQTNRKLNQPQEGAGGLNKCKLRKIANLFTLLAIHK